MSDFPQLKTAAIAQYPAEKTVRYATTVMQFVDGTGQRFREFDAPLRRWVIRLNLLNDNEVAALEEFFNTQQGRLNDFSFTDPWDDTGYPSCRLEKDSIVTTHEGVERIATQLIVRENRS